MIAWLDNIGVDKNAIDEILLQFLKPEYQITTHLELFALDDGDIDKILEPLPLGKKRFLKKAIMQEITGKLQ